jgi:branched-chain amino acid transport system ATP-binding protein
LDSCSITWFDQDLVAKMPYVRAEMGISHIPQGRGILGTLSVRDNVILGAYSKRTRAKRQELLQKVYAAFPILKERENLLAGTLSGGQQQMLAIGRAMMTDPQLLILDEPSLGLAPIMVEDVFRILADLKSQGTSMLIIEQNLDKALQIADRAYVLETGKIILSGEGRELLNNPDVRRAYLGVA